MSIEFNTTELTGHNFNGVDLTGHVFNGIVVFGSEAPALPEVIDWYELTDDISALIDGVDAQAGYKLVRNSGTGLPGLLCLANGDAYVPTSIQYPGNGTLDLSSGQYIDHQRVIDSSEVITGYYNIDTLSYSAYLLNYNQPAGSTDIYLYSSTVPIGCVPTYSNVPYTPPLVNWRTYEEPPSVIYPDAIEYSMKTVIEPLVNTYVSFGSALGDLPDCVSTINSLTDGTAIATEHPLLDELGYATNFTVSWDVAFIRTVVDYTVTGTDSGFLFDAQFLRGFYYNTGGVSTPHTITISGLDATHTYTFEVSGATNDVGKYTSYTMNSNETSMVITNNVLDGATEAGITGVTTFDIIVDALITFDPFMYVMGLNIKRTA